MKMKNDGNYSNKANEEKKERQLTNYLQMTRHEGLYKLKGR